MTPHVLSEVGRDYPVALVVPDALAALGALYEENGRLADASRAYKRLGAVAPDAPRRAAAIWSMARVQEARKLYVAALESYQELADALSRRHDRHIRRSGRRGGGAEAGA